MIIWNLPMREVGKHVMTQKSAPINGPRWVVFVERDEMPTSVSFWHLSSGNRGVVFEEKHLYYALVKGRVYVRVQQTTACHLFCKCSCLFYTAIPMFMYHLQLLWHYSCRAWVVTTEMHGPESLIFITWFFIGKICWPSIYITLSRVARKGQWVQEGPDHGSKSRESIFQWGLCDLRGWEVRAASDC